MFQKSLSIPNPFSKKPSLNEEPFEHGLKLGDHVIRWTHLLLYPIQVHGIVLSAGDGLVTIVDFGLSGSIDADKKNRMSFKPSWKKEPESCNNNFSQNYEEIVDVEARTMMRAWDKHRSDHGGKKRVRVLTLTEEKEIREWKKVDYGESLSKQESNRRSWKRLWQKAPSSNDNDCETVNEDSEHFDEDDEIISFYKDDGDKSVELSESPSSSNNVATTNQPCLSLPEGENDVNRDLRKEIDSATLNNDEESYKQEKSPKDTETSAQNTNVVERGKESKKASSSDAIITSNNQQSPSFSINDTQQISQPTTRSLTLSCWKKYSFTPTKGGNTSEIKTLAKNKTNKKNQQHTSPPPIPKLPKSDPINLVIARVRYLLHNPSILPPYHILYSNSECIAVWCKTGRWSTLQASVFLHSTAAGNAKSTAAIAAYVGAQTVTTTVPASGIAGWFGVTTTTTVSLVSVQPWLVPVLAGYGIFVVAMPVLILQKAKGEWQKATTRLTDGFWGWADADIFVEAIRSWSNLS